MLKPLVIKSATQEGRIKLYLEILYKFHKLTDKELSIVVVLIEQYYSIQDKYPSINDVELFNKLLFSTDTKVLLQKKLGMVESVFNNYLTALRKKGVIKDNKIVPSFIPDRKAFELIFKFPPV